MGDLSNNLRSKIIGSSFGLSQKNKSNQIQKLSEFMDYQNAKLYENNRDIINLKLNVPSHGYSIDRNIAIPSIFETLPKTNFKPIRSISEADSITSASRVIYKNTKNSQIMQSHTNSFSLDHKNRPKNYYFGFNNDNFEKNRRKPNRYYNNKIYSNLKSTGSSITTNGWGWSRRGRSKKNDYLLRTGNDSHDKNRISSFPDVGKSEVGKSFYYNKKINSNLQSGVDFRSSGRRKSNDAKTSKIYIKNKDRLNREPFRNENSDIANSIYYFENDSLFSNEKIYKKNIESTSDIFSGWRFDKNLKLNKNFFFKKSLGNKNYGYLGKVNRIISNRGFESEDTVNVPSNVLQNRPDNYTNISGLAENKNKNIKLINSLILPNNNYTKFKKQKIGELGHFYKNSLLIPKSAVNIQDRV